MSSAEQLFKVKQTSGRVLGPLDLERLRLLILKNQITGVETARRYPQGEWEDINAIGEIADLLVKKASGQLADSPPVNEPGPPVAKTEVFIAPTQVLSPPPAPVEMPDQQAVEEEEKTRVLTRESPEAPESSEVNDDGKADSSFAGSDEEDGKTRVVGLPEAPPEPDTRIEYPEIEPERNVGKETTIVFDRSQLASGTSTTTLPPSARRIVLFGGKVNIPDPRSLDKKSLIRAAVIAAAVGLLAQEFFFPDDQKAQSFQFASVKPRLPVSSDSGNNPDLSMKLYLQGMQYYAQDSVVGYKTAAEYLLQAASNDANNVRALAMLASSYLNLVDSSTKDENYFTVISKLIEMSRAKNTELLETVIADVEFFVVTNRAEAAQNRIVEFSKTAKNPELVVFFYLAYALYAKGDYASAARYMSQMQDSKIPTPKFFYYRGLVAERLNDAESAILQYQKAIQLGKGHARSRVRIAEILSKRGKLKEAAPYLDYVVTNPALLSPKDLSLAYYLHSQLNSLYQKWNLALADIERAVKLDPHDHDYLLEMYTLRAKLGESSPEFQKEARMYFFLGEGEKQLKENKYQDALTMFLKARQASLNAALPLEKIGDMFLQMSDTHNARLNYKLALERQPGNRNLAAKYLGVLIRGYEWEEAEKELIHLRGTSINPGILDKAQGDLYSLKGQPAQAAQFYKKAMAREAIDASVYIAFAKSLMEAKDFKDAPFFYALALRFDPSNAEALIGIAKCVAETDSVNRAVATLIEELQKLGGAKAELLAAIGEFQAQKGEWASAQQYVDQAMRANPDYAYPWKVQAKIHLAKEGADKNALENAIAALQSYIDRSPYDASGYYEKHKIYIKKLDYGSAEGELNRISAMYPKYPLIHFYKGQLFSMTGNHRQAVQEFDLELRNSPDSQPTLVAIGKSMIALSVPDEALKQLNAAMALNPKDPEAKVQAAVANYLLKNYAGSAALFEAAAALDPGNPQIYKRMGMAYREMGNFNSAHTAFQKYLEMEPDAPDRAEFQKY